MRLGTCLAAAWMVGCSSSLSYYGDNGGDGKEDPPATDVTTTDAPLIDTATGTPTDPTDPTETDTDVDADTDTDADADADADTDADADVDTGTAVGTGAPIDGVYQGSIHIDYEFKLPFV